MKREAVACAQTQLTIALASGAKSKNGRALTLSDFLPEFAKPRAEQAADERERNLKAKFMALAQNG